MTEETRCDRCRDVTRPFRIRLAIETQNDAGEWRDVPDPDPDVILCLSCVGVILGRAEGDPRFEAVMRHMARTAT